MQPLSDHEGIRKVLEVLYRLVPLLALLFYVLAAATRVCTLRTTAVRIRYQRVSRRLILRLTNGVTFTYLVDSAFNITILLDRGWRDSLTHDRNVYTCSSVLVWLILTMSLLESADPVWYPYYGSWLVVLVGEILLTTLSVIYHGPTNTIASIQLGVVAFRMCLLLSVLVVLFGGKCIRARYNQGDEENQPLLVSPHLDDSSEDSNTTRGSTQYGSFSPGGYSVGNTDWEAKQEEREMKARKRVEDRLPDNGNWWSYAKGFSVFLPFVWPSEDQLLQLYMIGVGLCLLAGRVLNVLTPRQVGIVTDALITSDGHVPWLEISLYILYSWLNSGAGVSALKNYFWLPVEQYAYKAISAASYNHVMNLSSEFHDSKRSGELYQTRNLGHSVINLLETIMIQIIPTLVDLAVASAYLYHLFGVYMALIVAAVVVAHLWASTYFNARQIQIRRELISNLHKEWQTMYNSMGSWQTVSYFNRIKHEQERYSSAVEAHMLSQWEYTALAYLAKALQSSVLTVGLVGACFVAAYQVVYGDQSVGNCVILLTYWAQLSGPLTFIGPAFRQISKDFLDAEQLLQVLQYKPSVAERAGAKPLVLSQGGIEFNNVHFSYDSRRQTLNGISFRALPGQTVALVGESGGGKSTILKLLFRFYDVAQGNIKIDGQDIRDITLESLRENLGMVPQDPSLFNENIISNIRYAKLSATEEDVYDACKAAAIHDKIMSFTDGYQSIVGERGVKLSGGELQRIAIARAILKNPNIVLLDEATCSVDTETAKHIQKGLRKLTAGRTTFVVAHRRSTIMKADHIIVIKNGAILEQGTHNDLLFAKGSYYNTWSKKILVGKSQDRSKNPKKSPPVTIVNDLDATAETQTPLEAFSSTPDDHGQENTQPARSQYQKQKGFNHQENKPAEDQTLPVVKHDKAGKGTLSSLRDKLWRPDVPEFIPHYLRTTFGLRGQPSNQPQVSSDQLNPDGQGDRLAGIPAEVGNKSTWKGVPTTFKDDSNTGRQETLAAQAPEDGTTSLKVEMEKKRRWRKRKSREHEESVRQTPADDKGEDIGTKAKRQRTHRRSKSRSDPTGQRRKKTDEARQTEPAIARSPDRQPASNVLRRVSAPSDPPSGETTAGMESSAGRRRRAVQGTRDSDAAPSRGTVRFAEGS